MSQVQTDTRSRLLESASEVFVEKGFHEATVQEICDRASANIAGVNYHFGGKDALYDEVWRNAFDLATEAYPLHGNLPEDSTPEQRLHAMITALLSRVLSDDRPGWFPRLQVHEMSHPTASLRERFETTLRPHLHYMESVVSGIVGPHVKAARLRICTMSVVSQCLFYGFTRSIQEFAGHGQKMTSAELEMLANHITTFSITGLRAATADAREGEG